jgi:DNA polymerase bacteriophage-type
VNGMFEAESEGYTVIGTVHDEILTEVPVAYGSVHELEKIVCRLPQWAHGLPIGAEGFESYRYRKG